MLTAQQAREGCLPKLQAALHAYLENALSEVSQAVENGLLGTVYQVPSYGVGYVSAKLKALGFEVEVGRSIANARELHIDWLAPEEVATLVLQREANTPTLPEYGRFEPPNTTAAGLAHCPSCRRIHDQAKPGQVWRHFYSQKLFAIGKNGYGLEWTTGERTTSPVNGLDQGWSYVAPSVQNALERGVLSQGTCYNWPRWAGLGS
ncbi:hypothetical protein Dcar01_02377 [Deinococcus carri]|uniref:Uncharacterized protein n=1 Tax=Deinococcus carri TaxID=1211323 RepID=A0ABP9WAR4_9DEIO